MLTTEKTLQIDDAMRAAVKLLDSQQSFCDITVPVNVPSMARRIVGDIMGWPLHVRIKNGVEDPDHVNDTSNPTSQHVMPIMRHKPAGVFLLDPRKRAPRAPRPKQSSSELEIGSVPVKPESSSDPQAGKTYQIGAAVRKEFDGTTYNGTIARCDEFNGEMFYLVIYDD